NGRFVLRGLIAARYIVSAYKDEQRAEVRNVDPSKQKDVALSLDDQASGIVYGTVTGIPAPSSGKVTRRTVFISSEESGTEGMIDEAGNYRIEDAPAGPVYVTAQIESTGSSLSSVRKQVVVTPGQATRVDLDVTGAVRVSGRVLLDGRPLPAARVSFSTNDGMMASTISRDDGGYDIALAGPGRFRIYAFAERTTPRQFSTTRDIRGGETIDLDLREQIIEGTIVDATTREPIDEAVVTLTAFDTEMTSIVSEVRAEARGRFRFETSNVGPHRLTASARGYAQRMVTLNLGGPSALTPFTFELSPVTELRVRVIDAKTNAPLEASLYLTDADGNYIPVRAERAFDGTAYIFFAAPGKYGVAVTVYGYQPKRFEVTAPGAVELKLE
ncbi:MAG TPA: carboxypeptidase regulatory-like domain-containing protein, partial [Thermoanaerobaculia bacterium]